MKKKSYRDLFVWQASVDVAVRIVALTDGFPMRRLVLIDQMQRAANSVASNIAEGQGRLTRREERRFYGIARGSLYELQTQLEIAARAGLIDPASLEELLPTLRKIGVGVNRLITRLNPLTTQPLSDCFIS
jgi:four helix bundle protein